MADYCNYPPQLAFDVESAEQRDGERVAFVIGSLAVGRFLLLGETEERVLRLIDGTRTSVAVCAEFERQQGATLSLSTLTRFLARLDEAGILAGARAHRPPPADQQPTTQFYWRCKLFNPDRLFERMIIYLRWVWTPGFVFASVALMLTALLLALTSEAEVTRYGLYAVREHYLMILIASELIVLSHEFAHGLTCKAFGGRVPEFGLLQIYYVLPALYCNVSGIHLIPKRSRRLWVIAAGIYWQVLVGTVALLSWFLLAPYTLLADLAFCVFLAGVVDVIFNANPLIKLDGYYFLSQWLRLPNLMDRSRAYWRGLLKRILFGAKNEAAEQWSRRERKIYCVFGLFSFVYTVGLRTAIVFYVGSYLADWWQFTGLLLAALLALFYMRQMLWQLSSAAIRTLRRTDSVGDRVTAFASNAANYVTVARGTASSHVAYGGTMVTNNETALPRVWRPRLVMLAIALSVVVVLCLPWQASVGNYGTLMAIPTEEAIIRAPENGTLVSLSAQPGQQVAAGTLVGQMRSLELEEQMVQVQTELARAGGDYDRLFGEQRTSEEATLRAALQLRQRENEYDEINTEQRRIQERLDGEVSMASLKFLPVSAGGPPLGNAYAPQIAYPAALAALQAKVDERRAQLDEARTELERSHKLFTAGIVPRNELDAAETRVATLAAEQAAARQRLEAALVTHRRQHANTATEMKLARSDVNTAALQGQKLDAELQAIGTLTATLADRRELLRRKQAQFELLTPRAGTVFGEDLPRLVGQYLQKGTEICRVADTRRLLLRVNVPEREIGSVRVGLPVRLRTRAFPEHTFHGEVSKIGAESERDENNQATYRVELTIENADGVLRPGMTAFARIDFGSQIIGSILLHKIKQVLRPELWLF